MPRGLPVNASGALDMITDENVISIDVLSRDDEGVNWTILVNQEKAVLTENKIEILIEDTLIMAQTMDKSEGLSKIEVNEDNQYFTLLNPNEEIQFITFRTTFKDETTKEFTLKATIDIDGQKYMAEKKVVVDSRVKDEPNEDEPQIEDPKVGDSIIEEPKEEEPKEQLPEEVEPVLEDPAVEDPEGEEPLIEEPLIDELEEKNPEEEPLLEQEIERESEGEGDTTPIPWENVIYNSKAARSTPRENAFNRGLTILSQNYVEDTDGKYPSSFTQGNNIRNPDPERVEVDEGFITKKASNGAVDGEFFIDLKIEGKQIENAETVDVVLILDNSGSMSQDNRRANANAAATILANGLLQGNSLNKMALVTYGATLKAGNSLYTLTTNPNDIINKLPSSTGGFTFTQEALVKAEQIIATSTANKKYIVLISDGVPTRSYVATQVVPTTPGNAFIDYDGITNPLFRATTFSNSTRGNGNYDIDNYNVNGFGINNNGFATISQALLMKTKPGAPTIYTVGVELKDNYGATEEEAYNIMKNIASSENNYFNADDANDLADILDDITTSIQKKINSGVVIDPMSSMVNLNKGIDGILNPSDYTLTASNTNLLINVTVQEDPAGTIKLSGLNLGANEFVNLQYKINLKTEDPSFVPETYYLTNERTYLIPFINGLEREFSIPAVKGLGLNIEGTKKWFNDTEEDRPENITINLNRSITGGSSVFVKSITLTKTDFPNAQTWGYSFTGLPMHDNLGNEFTYTVSEDLVTGYGTTIEGFEIRNTLKFGELTIKKTKDDGLTPIDTAKFKLTQGTTVIQEVETIAGIAKFTNLQPGTYSLVESQAPTGYLINSDVYEVVVSLVNNNFVVTVSKGGVAVESNPLIVINKALGSIQIAKIDSLNENNLPGAEFDLYRQVEMGSPGAIEFTMLDGSKIYGIKINNTPLVTNSNGQTVKIENLLLGTYFVVETKAPDGYYILEEPVIIAITEDNLTVLETIENLAAPMIPMTGGIGTMIFSIIGLALMGGALLGYRKHTNTNNKGVKIMKGKKLFTMFFSALILFVFMAPMSAKAVVGNANVRTKPETTKVTIHKMELVNKLNALANHDGRELTSTELDTVLGAGNYTTLNGAGFTYWKIGDGLNVTQLASKTIADLNTDYGTGVALPLTSNGGKVSADLANGSYYFRETTMPNTVSGLQGVPFMLGLPTQNSTRDGYLTNVHIYPKNMAIRGAVVLTKLAKETPLAGATFRLYKADDTEFVPVGATQGALLTTDPTGRIYVNNLPAGNYYFKEKTAPIGYLLNESKITFSIKENGKVEFVNGVWVIDSTVPRVSLQNNTGPEIKKTVEDQEKFEASVDFGQIKTYFINVKLPDDIATYTKLDIKDMIDTRLDYMGNLKVEATIDGTTFIALPLTSYTATELVGNRELLIKFIPLQLIGKLSVRISFDVRVNSTAVMSSGIMNKATLDFNNQFVEVLDRESNETKLFTGGALFLKFDADTSGENLKVLQGAEFAVKNSSGQFLKVTNGDEYSWVANLSDTTFRITSNNLGEFDIKGLAYDVTNGTTYFLYETVAPLGADGFPYALNDNDIPFVVNGSSYYSNIALMTLNKPIGISNTLGPRIPQTGGIGTILFTLLGSGLMGSALFLNRKKRSI